MFFRKLLKLLHSLATLYQVYSLHKVSTLIQIKFATTTSASFANFAMLEGDRGSELMIQSSASVLPLGSLINYAREKRGL